MSSSQNFKWQAIERTTNAAVLFILGVVVARIIGPKEYGLISLTTVFITFADLIVNGGLGSALIQKENVTSKEINAIFTVTSFVALLMTSIIICISPVVASYYNIVKLKYMLYMYALGIWPFSIYGLLRSLLMRNLQYKLMCKVACVSLVVSCITAVCMAIAGFGVFSMIAQSLCATGIGLVMLMLVMKPHFKINLVMEWGMISYGWKLLAANLIDVTYKNVPTVVVPKAYGTKMLSFFTYGRQIPNVIISTINSVMVTVMFPTFSKKQNDLWSVKESLRKTIIAYSTLFFPLMATMAMSASEITLLLVGKEWQQSYFSLSCFCFAYVWVPLHAINFQAISALGDSGGYLAVEIVRKIVGLSMFFISIFFSVNIMLVVQVATSLVFWVIGMPITKRKLDYSYTKQIKDIISPLIASLVIVVIMIVLNNFVNAFYIWKLVIKIAVALIVFVIYMLCFNHKLSQQILMHCNSYLKKKEK